VKKVARSRVGRVRENHGSMGGGIRIKSVGNPTGPKITGLQLKIKQNMLAGVRLVGSIRKTQSRCPGGWEGRSEKDEKRE